MPKTHLLSPQQRILYAKYGKALAELPVMIETLANQLGVTRWTMRRVSEHVSEYGPPLDEELPSWRVVVIPDAHFGPGEDCSRARLFGLEITRQGRFAMEQGERFAFCSIGDWHDMQSFRGELADMWLPLWDEFDGRSVVKEALERDQGCRHCHVTIIHCNVFIVPCTSYILSLSKPARSK